MHNIIRPGRPVILRPKVGLQQFKEFGRGLRHEKARNRSSRSSQWSRLRSRGTGDFTNSTQVLLGGGAPFPLNSFAPLETGGVCALAGPAELIFSNAVLFTFYRLTNSAIHTQGIANDPIGIQIASNKTMHVIGVPASVNASFSGQDGGSLSFALEPNRPADFTGPGTLYLSSGVLPPYIKFISYFMAEDGFVIPDQSAVAGPTGNAAVVVEKSADLTTWSPVIMEIADDPVKAYYRLRIQH